MSRIDELHRWERPLSEMRHWVAQKREGPDVIAVHWRDHLVAIDGVLQSGEVTPADSWKLHALGVALGDAISGLTGAQWMEFSDEYGCEPCLLIDRATQRVAFPLSMVSGKVELGHSVSFDDLVDVVISVAKGSEWSTHVDYSRTA